MHVHYHNKHAAKQAKSNFNQQLLSHLAYFIILTLFKNNKKLQRDITFKLAIIDGSIFRISFSEDNESFFYVKKCCLYVFISLCILCVPIIFYLMHQIEWIFLSDGV